MSEAEVALRLAFHLVSLPDSSGHADVSLDGAQVAVHGKEVFPVGDFLSALQWMQVAQKGKNPWQGTYRRGSTTLDIDAHSGVGDVVCAVGKRRIRAECKQGDLLVAKGNPEYHRLREALGQILTVSKVEDHDVLVVAAPESPTSRRLAAAWLSRPLVKAIGVRIALISRTGEVAGLEGLTRAI